MTKARPLTFLVCYIMVLTCCGQVIPVPDAKLNYTQVMFDHPWAKGASSYILQIIEDSKEATFDHPFKEQQDSSTATLISNLQFGKKYLWRYMGNSPAAQSLWNGPYAFEITADSFINRGIVTLTVTQNDSISNAGGLIVNDATHTIVDRSGKIVWYLNKVNWFFKYTQWSKTVDGVQSTNKSNAITPVISDLRVTPAGTITYLADSVAAEYDLNGNLLWKAPNNCLVSGSGGEGYNHDFKRLPNGHYMVLGNQFWRKLPTYTDTPQVKKKYFERRAMNGTEYAKVEFGTVIEYDKAGKVVWSWNSASYFDADPLQPIMGNSETDREMKPHVNAFSVDRKNQFVYVGFRDVDRIVKVEKSTGKVVDSWGLQLPVGWAKHPVNMHLQHDANILDDGTLAIFNNNDYPGRDSIPSVIILSQPDSGKVLWQFNCGFDSLNRRATRNGGNVDQLSNGNFLVCLGNLNRIWEVTKDKRLVWQATIKMNPKDGVDYSYRLYRAHYISSLYPCYFTFQPNTDSISRKEPRFSIKLFNKGSESDTYVVKVTAPSGELLEQFNLAELAPGHSVNREIV